MTLLETIKSPSDLRGLDAAALEQLAADIRSFLITHVAATGGHLGPNLGVVELTLAVHRVFDSPRDSIVFDTGHQSYVHKLLTGRQDFSTLRQQAAWPVTRTAANPNTTSWSPRTRRRPCPGRTGSRAATN